MEARAVLKALRDFASTELREKRADRVMVRTFKMKQVLRRGRRPDSGIKTVEGAYYLVCVFRGGELRIYQYDGGGNPLGASDFRGKEMEDEWENVSKATRNAFTLSS